MKNAFQMTFSMDQPEDREDEDDYGFEAGFLVEDPALGLLAKDLSGMAKGQLNDEEYMDCVS